MLSCFKAPYAWDSLVWRSVLWEIKVKAEHLAQKSMAQLKCPCRGRVAFTSSEGWCEKRGGIEEDVRDEFVEMDSRTVTPKRCHNALKILLEMFSLSSSQTNHRPNLLNWKRRLVGFFFYLAVLAADAIFGLATDWACICPSLSPMRTVQSNEVRQILCFFCQAENNSSEYWDG